MHAHSYEVKNLSSELAKNKESVLAITVCSVMILACMGDYQGYKFLLH